MFHSSYPDRFCTYTYHVKGITKVVDGDTVDVTLDLGFGVFTEQRVRLLGIDCEETRTRDPVEKRYGKLAKKQLRHWCYNKPSETMQIRCETRDPKDKFGRALGELWIQDVNVNKWMVDNHFAVAYNGQSKEDLRGEHLENRERVKLEIL
jgi:micrococcal nuclease